MGTTPPQTATSPPPNGGNGVIRTTTRRRHADRQPLMLQNPHHHRRGGHRTDHKARPRCRYARHNSPNAALSLFNPRQNSPSKPKNTNFGVFSARWANFFALTPTSSRAGRTFSRTGHSHVARLKPKTPLRPLMQDTMKPPSPLLTPQQQPLKPTTPLQPQNAQITPISHPQRR